MEYDARKVYIAPGSRLRQSIDVVATKTFQVGDSIKTPSGYGNQSMWGVIVRLGNGFGAKPVAAVVWEQDEKVSYVYLTSDFLIQEKD